MRKNKQVLQRNGLILIDGRLYTDANNAPAARAFVAKLRASADEADARAEAVTADKARRLRQNARQARKDAERILSTL